MTTLKLTEWLFPAISIARLMTVNKMEGETDAKLISSWDKNVKAIYKLKIERSSKNKK